MSEDYESEKPFNPGDVVIVCKSLNAGSVNYKYPLNTPHPVLLTNVDKENEIYSGYVISSAMKWANVNNPDRYPSNIPIGNLRDVLVNTGEITGYYESYINIGDKFKFDKTCFDKNYIYKGRVSKEFYNFVLGCRKKFLAGEDVSKISYIDKREYADLVSVADVLELISDTFEKLQKLIDRKNIDVSFNGKRVGKYIKELKNNIEYFLQNVQPYYSYNSNSNSDSNSDSDSQKNADSSEDKNDS